MAANLTEIVLLDTLSSAITLAQTNQIGGVQIDTTLAEAYEDTLEVTEHPVEAGAEITDHSFKRPMQLVLSCGWTDSSISGLLGVAGGIVTGLFGGTNPAAGETASFAGGAMIASDYVAGIYSQLLALQEARQPVVVTSQLRVYSNMLVVSLRVRRDQKTQYALLVEAVLREVILVSTSSSTLAPQANQSAPASTADTTNVGSQQLQSASPAAGGAFPIE